MRSVNRLLIIVFFGVMIIMMAGVVSGADCSIQMKSAFNAITNNPNNVVVLELSSNTNAHASKIINNNLILNRYYLVCQKSDVGDIDLTCNPSSRKIVKLASDTNSHLEAPDQNNYNVPICLDAISQCNIKLICSPGEIGVMSLSAVINAHIGPFSGLGTYPYKVCCSKSTSTCINDPSCNSYRNMEVPGNSYCIDGNRGYLFCEEIETGCFQKVVKSETCVSPEICGGSYAYAECSIPLETCFDGRQNQDETGIDCGGATCSACPTGPSCNDGTQNQDETGIDCGGATCSACPIISDHCGSDADGNGNDFDPLQGEECDGGAHCTDCVCDNTPLEYVSNGDGNCVEDVSYGVCDNRPDTSVGCPLVLNENIPYVNVNNCPATADYVCKLESGKCVPGYDNLEYVSTDNRCSGVEDKGCKWLPQEIIGSCETGNEIRIISRVDPATDDTIESLCNSPEQIRICPRQVKVPFFTFHNAAIAVGLIILIYILIEIVKKRKRISQKIKNVKIRRK